MGEVRRNDVILLVLCSFNNYSLRTIELGTEYPPALSFYFILFFLSLPILSRYVFRIYIRRISVLIPWRVLVFANGFVLLLETSIYLRRSCEQLFLFDYAQIKLVYTLTNANIVSCIFLMIYLFFIVFLYPSLTLRYVSPFKIVRIIHTHIYIQIYASRSRNTIIYNRR